MWQRNARALKLPHFIPDKSTSTFFFSFFNQNFVRGKGLYWGMNALEMYRADTGSGSFVTDRSLILF